MFKGQAPPHSTSRMASLDFGQTQIWLLLPVALWEELVCFFVRDGGEYDDLVAVLPVGGSRDAVGVGKLQRVDHSEQFVEVPAGRSRVNQRQPDDSLWVDNED